MKSLNLKQFISDVFILKYKKLTILLGIIVPFFACYILAITSKKALRNSIALIILIVLVGSCISIIYLMIFNFTILAIEKKAQIIFFTPILGLYLVFNWMITDLLSDLIYKQ